MILLQAAAGQAIDISWGQKRTNGLQKQVSPRERPSPIFSDCDNIPNNATREKEEQSGKSVRIGCELHFDN